MNLENITDLEKLQEYILEFNHKHFADNGLIPLSGGGQSQSPKIMFIFINPTKKNIATDPDWKGPRVPWIGIKPIWKIFWESGFISDSIFTQIYDTKTQWTPEFTNQVYNQLVQKSIYLTNIVKWVGEDASLPEKQKIALYLPILLKEIAIVRPSLIITMGQIPFQALTLNKQKLDIFYQKFINSDQLQFTEFEVGGFKTQILPCYFPVGMGRFNRDKAVNILSKVSRSL